MRGEPPDKRPRVRRTAPPEAITFGSFRLDRRSGQLMRGGEAIALRPKTWSVLLYLAERPGMLVSKDEILDAIWSDVTVTDSVLSKSISELRVALDDSFRKPHVIETVQRRGFRFIARIGRPDTAVSAASRLESPSAPWAIRSLASPVGRPSATLFVGREEELRRLTASVAMAHAGERQVVFVTGPAGIGKTSLVGALLDSPVVREARPPVWSARGLCIEQHGPREPYMPVIQALEALARHHDAARLATVLRRVAPTWLAQMPSLIGDDEHALRQSLQVVRPERMLREFASFVEALTTDVMLLLVLEDLHWSDPSTIDLLVLLAQRNEPARMLVVGTFRCADAIVREHAVMSAMRMLSVRRRCGELPLSDLSEGDVTAYLAARFPGSDFPPALARRIHRQTDGNPLFMIGIVDRLRSLGYILDTAPGWALGTSVEKIDLGVPDDVRLLIENDLNALSPAEAALLQAASVAGEDFTALVVAAALGHEMNDVELRCEGLARAQRFLRVAGHVEWPDHTVARRYVFVHELYRQAVYARITDGQCMQLHQRIGQALEAAYAARQTDVAPLLALHFERAHDDARALRYLTLAGERARLRFASREAMEYLEAALGLLERLPEDDSRRRQELELRLALGATLSDIHGFASEQVRTNYERAAELCAAVGNEEQLLGILYARWYLHANRAERSEAMAIAAQVDELARRLGGREHRILSESVLLRTATYDGRFTEARRIARRRFAQPPSATVPAPAFGADPGIAATMHSAHALWFLGHPDRARTTAQAAIDRAREFGHFFTLAAVLMQAALLELLCRNPATGGELADEAVSLSTEHGFAFWRILSRVMRAWGWIQQGRATEGVDAIVAELEVMEATRMRLLSAFAFGFLGEGYLCNAAFADGLGAVDAGLAVANATLDRAYEPELWRLKGELLVARTTVEGSRPRRGSAKTDGPDPASAETCFVRALESARAIRATSLELRAATSLARLWHGGGRTADAGELLAGICRWFGTSAAFPDLVEARDLLQRFDRA